MAEEIKISNWLCIAQEGKTIDGREIKRDWLLSAVKNYSPEYYQALIWCEHEDPMWRQWGANLGTVEELKTEEKDGKLRLMARLRANHILQTLNEQEQKLFTSVELMGDFPNEGDYYLVGLAATDQPASTGLSRLAFSNENGKQSFRTQFIQLNTEAKTAKKSVFNLLFKKEKLSMTQEEIDALVAELEAANAKIAELETTISELNDKLAKDDVDGAKADGEKAAEQVSEVSDTVESAADKAELSRLKKQNIELSKKVETLEQKFNSAVKTPVTPTPGIGAGNKKESVELY